MNLHSHLRSTHQRILAQAKTIQENILNHTNQLETYFSPFYVLLKHHIQQEDACFYGALTPVKLKDRTLLHDLRNDHAALLFALDSLKMKLQDRAAFQMKWDKVAEVLNAHFQKEESDLFKRSEKVFTPEEEAAILNEMPKAPL